MRILAVDVPEGLPERWRAWLAPARQPFYLTPAQRTSWGLSAGEPSTDPHLRDTYTLYCVTPGLDVVWLDETEFHALPRPVRAGIVRAQVDHERGAVPTVRRYADLVDARTQADGHRFVWWPSMVTDEVLERFVVDDGWPASRHAEVPGAVWDATLPGAQALAGTFPPGSGPNCFGTVMAAAGVADADTEWMQREPFEAWLAASTAPGGRDCDAGTVLVWRGTDGLAQHAAVTLGGGWALNKPSQCWYAPRVVLAVADVIATSRTAGWHLTRRRLTR
ncbi:hypothetical protein Lfu02_77090 [Longispora fulva]|uniref:Uncharacterized protein n=1 Tax=Longispora fulva TaxID=619741 RepID=A0A8J7KW67_9ACTN|nr:hypothetical protein [Longispora fulva]MBG6136172.1 hypothetical protein [Longispora fulva]GIG63337.1 hypothetical protein Lfu02_77090 [Longispora fulva]